MIVYIIRLNQLEIEVLNIAIDAPNIPPAVSNITSSTSAEREGKNDWRYSSNAAYAITKIIVIINDVITRLFSFINARKIKKPNRTNKKK